MCVCVCCTLARPNPDVFHHTSSCTQGQYLNTQQSSTQQCTTGRELSMPGCLPCSAVCTAGEYVDGSCNGTQAENTMSCEKCTAGLISGGEVSVCPAASTLPVRRGQSTFVQMASEFRRNCTEAKGLDCMRRQALMYPFDGNDQEEDLAPWNRRCGIGCFFTHTHTHKWH
jgi:hypothetical protein